MAVFTTTDRDNVKTALITAAVEGVASVTVGGQAVQTYTLEQLQKLLAMIMSDIAGDATAGAPTRMGMRLVKTVPPGAG
jgi:hypothetical protein